METSLQYPIGKFTPQDVYTPEDLQKFLARIEALPGKVEAAIAGLTDAQLDTPYREGGWTVRQVVHHLPDSHMNAYVRVKWTLTEETPTIKAYDEKGWACTPDTKLSPGPSIEMLKALHNKLVPLLRGLSAKELKRQFFHPDSKKLVKLETLIGTYAWHGDHHLAHIEGVR